MNRLKNLNFLLSFAALGAFTLSATTQSGAQSGNVAGDGMSPANQQAQPAPIERHDGAAQGVNQAPMHGPAYNVRRQSQQEQIVNSQPAQGIYLRVAPHSAVTTVAATPARTELRVDRGVANVDVHHSQQGAEIVVDLPGGQVSLLKDGLYTFNAETKTVRVLKGEAAAFAAANTNGKGIKVKEDHELAFGAARLRSVGADPYVERADLLPMEGYGRGGGYGFSGAPAYGPYGDGFYGGDAYYDGYYGYPYGYGYPFLGFGFGYYGGFRGGYGGFRGGYGGGFHGRR